MQLLYDYALTSDWLISPLLNRDGLKKWEGEKDIKTEERNRPLLLLFFAGALKEERLKASSHQELKQRQLINRARQIRSP